MLMLLIYFKKKKKILARALKYLMQVLVYYYKLTNVRNISFLVLFLLSKTIFARTHKHICVPCVLMGWLFSFIPNFIGLKICTFLQVLKRLKKFNPANDQSSSPRIGLSGGIAPVSLKIRQHLRDPRIRRDENSMKVRLRESYVKSDLPPSLASNVREVPYLELGPKDLKVKGPSFSNDVIDQSSYSFRLPADEDRKARASKHFSS